VADATPAIGTPTKLTVETGTTMGVVAGAAVAVGLASGVVATEAEVANAEVAADDADVAWDRRSLNATLALILSLLEEVDVASAVLPVASAPGLGSAVAVTAEGVPCSTWPLTVAPQPVSESPRAMHVTTRSERVDKHDCSRALLRRCTSLSPFIVTVRSCPLPAPHTPWSTPCRTWAAPVAVSGTASMPTILLRLDVADFRRLMAQHSELARRIEAEAKRRLGDNRRRRDLHGRGGEAV